MERENADGRMPDAEQARRILGSSEGKRLLALLSRDGGTALRQAATAWQSGDTETVKQLLAPLLQTPETAALLRALEQR